MKRTNTSKVSKKFKAAALATLVATMPLLSLTGCEFGGGNGGKGGTEDVSNDNGGDTCAEGDTTCTGGDTGGDIGGDDPVTPPVTDDRIVLASEFNTAATDDIEPVEIYETTMTYGTVGTSSYYSETFRTAFFNKSQIQDGKKYSFEGEIDSETDKVKTRIWIRDNVTDIDIKVTNAQLTSGSLYGTNKIDITVPNNGTFCFPPFGKCPVLEADSESDTTTITASPRAKKRIGGEAPVLINP